jgi:hypothetical protein
MYMSYAGVLNAGMCNQNIPCDVIASGTETGNVWRMMLEHWNLLEMLTLARDTYTYVWAQNAGGTEQKISVEAITN